MSSARDRSITIVGAGPVGLTVAALMAKSGAHPALQIRILEPRPIPSWEPTNTDLRVYALSRASQRILEHVDVWGEIAAARISPYRAMRVWEGEDPFGLGSLYFDCAELGESDLGHIVEDRLIRDRLFSSLSDCTNVELRVGVEVAAVRPGPRDVEIETRDGETFSSTVLVAADGAASTVRELMNLPVTTADYEQEAIVAHVESSEPHRETAWQRFLPSGPLAFLPLVD
ncbi:MAG: FAD-dependent monooxygenase, partial [Gammaproteobacteria bacterium]